MFPDLAKLRELTEKAKGFSDLEDLVAFFSADAVKDAQWPDEAAPLSFASDAYVTRFRQRLIDAGSFTPDEVEAIMRHARAYAGGMARAAQRQEGDGEPDDIAASENFWQLPALGRVAFSQGDVGKLTPWMQITPKAGSQFTHPRYGKVSFTREMASEMVRNFQGRVYQEHIPIDAEHDLKTSGALGYFRELRVAADGSVEARIELTDRGAKLREQDAFRYFSPEFFRAWRDPATEKVYNHLLIGGAFTTRPFFKDQHLAPLAASEGSYSTWSMSGKGPHMASRYQKDAEGNFILDADGNPQLTAEAIAEDAKAAEAAALTASEQALAAFREQHKLGEDGKPLPTPPADTKAQGFAEQYPEEAARMAEQAKELARLRHGEQVRRFTDVTRGVGGEGDGSRPWLGETAKHVEHMISLAERFGEDSEQFNWYVEMNREHAEQAHKAGIFSEHGSTSTGNGSKSADDRATAAAKELQKTNSNLSFSEALDQALRNDPSLYEDSIS